MRIRRKRVTWADVCSSDDTDDDNTSSADFRHTSLLIKSQFHQAYRGKIIAPPKLPKSISCFNLKTFINPMEVKAERCPEPKYLVLNTPWSCLQISSDASDAPLFSPTSTLGIPVSTSAGCAVTNSSQYSKGRRNDVLTNARRRLFHDSSSSGSSDSFSDSFAKRSKKFLKRKYFASTPDLRISALLDNGELEHGVTARSNNTDEAICGGGGGWRGQQVPWWWRKDKDEALVDSEDEESFLALPGTALA